MCRPTRKAIYPEARPLAEKAPAAPFPYTAVKRSLEHLAQQSMERYPVCADLAERVRIIHKGRAVGRSTMLAMDFGAPEGDMSAVWAFAGGVPVLMHPSWIDDQMEVLKPYHMKVMERFGVQTRAALEREAAALADLKPIVIPPWPALDLTGDELAARRATCWEDMRKWIDGQRVASFGLPASLMRTEVGSGASTRAMHEAIRSGTGMIRTSIGLDGRPSSHVVPMASIYRDDVQDDTESAPSSAGADPHQNKE